MTVDSQGPIFVELQQSALLQFDIILTLKSTLPYVTKFSFNQCSWGQTFPLGAYALPADTIRCYRLKLNQHQLILAFVQTHSSSPFPAHAEL